MAATHTAATQKLPGRDLALPARWPAAHRPRFRKFSDPIWFGCLALPARRPAAHRPRFQKCTDPIWFWLSCPAGPPARRPPTKISKMLGSNMVLVILPCRSAGPPPADHDFENRRIPYGLVILPRRRSAGPPPTDHDFENARIPYGFGHLALTVAMGLCSPAHCVFRVLWPARRHASGRIREDTLEA